MAERVVFLRSKSPAGIEPRLEKEAVALAKAGYEVHAILWDRERAHPAYEERSGVRIHRYPLRAPEGEPSLLAYLPRWWCHAFRTAVRLRPRVVHGIDFDAALPSVAAARVLGARLVYEVFDFYAEMVVANLPSRFRRQLATWERRVARAADLVVLPDRRREVQLAGVRPRRILEILNVPEDRSFPEEPGPDFVVFYGGMIARDRGLKDLVVAVEATGAKLLVAGHGPHEAELLPLIETSPAAMYLGTIPYEEVLRHTAKAQAIVALYDPAIPNNRYAAPNKVFEAMMLAKPVIVSDGTAAAEIVRGIGCGLVVPYGDPGALRSALERLMLSPAECEALGARGRAAFEREYNWAAMEGRLLQAYGELLA